MRNLKLVLVAMMILGSAQGEFALAKTKKKQTPVAQSLNSFFKKLGTALKAPAPKKVPRKKSGSIDPNVVAVTPMTMPESIRQLRQGSAQPVQEVAAAPEALQMHTYQIPAVPEVPAAPANPYLGRECKSEGQDEMMCMTCIIYFERQRNALAQDGHILSPLEIAQNVQNDIQSTGSSACFELRAERPDRTGEFNLVYKWISTEAGVNTELNQEEALAHAYSAANQILTGSSVQTAEIQNDSAAPAAQ